MKVNLLKKAGSAILAAAMAANSTAIGGTILNSIAADAAKYEFEDGTLTGCTIQEDGTERYAEGASGDKFVFLQDAGEIAAVTVSVPETGMYSITLCYSAPYGEKIHNLYVNGVDQGQVGCAKTESGQWVEISLGSVKLNKGDNEVAIKSSWGWTDLDYITVEESSLPAISASQNTCSDKLATKETQNLMSYLASVYGKNIISGQQEIYMYGHDFEQEFKYLESTTGKLPAIRGFDFLNEANILGYGTEDGTSDRIISWCTSANQYSGTPGIATASWHLTVPIDFDNYTLGQNVAYEAATYEAWADNEHTKTKSSFDTANVIVEGTKENEYYMACLEELAGYLKKIQDANVPLIFRPLHEAEGAGGETGSWFWWGTAGSAVYKQIWQLTYKTLTEDYGIHNLIWEWNSYAYDTSSNWYPGDEYVDIIGYDKYNCTDWSTGSAVFTHNDSAISSTFYNIMQKYSSKKMVAMAENDCFSTVENLTTEKAGWLYFCTWYDGEGGSAKYLSDPMFNTLEDTVAMYQSDYCITLDELPEDLYSEVSEFPTAPSTETTEPDTTDTTEATTEGKFVFTTKKYPITLSQCGEDDAYLTISIEGEPKASIGGGLGYADSEDWINVEWSGNADEDGNLLIKVPLADIPAETTSAELQIWWSNVWDSDTETATDTDCEMVSYEIVNEAASSTLYGDADLNDTVDITDAARIMSYVSNNEKYPLEAQGLDNADVYQRGDGISNMDALAVQKRIAQLITELPES